MTIEKSILEKLAEAEIKAWVESSEGGHYLSDVMRKAIDYYFTKGFGRSIGNDIEEAISKKAKEIFESKYDSSVINELVAFGFKVKMEGLGYEVKIKKKGEHK